MDKKSEENKIEEPIKEEPKEEVFMTPEIGSEGTPTGRTVVYRRGELGERWRLMKKAAETDQERLDIADTELRHLKREQVMYNKDKKAFTDDFGNVYQQGKEVNDKNNLVRAKAVVILNENKIKIPNYANKFMFSKSRDWKEEPINEDKVDWVTGMSQESLEKEERKKRAQLELAKIKNEEAPKEDINPTLTRAEEIKRYVESLPQPSIEQIIRNRVAIRNRYSGIGSLKFEEPEYEIGRPKSFGLNYLTGLDDEE